MAFKMGTDIGSASVCVGKPKAAEQAAGSENIRTASQMTSFSVESDWSNCHMFKKLSHFVASPGLVCVEVTTAM